MSKAKKTNKKSTKKVEVKESFLKQIITKRVIISFIILLGSITFAISSKVIVTNIRDNNEKKFLYNYVSEALDRSSFKDYKLDYKKNERVKEDKNYPGIDLVINYDKDISEQEYEDLVELLRLLDSDNTSVLDTKYYLSSTIFKAKNGEFRLEYGVSLYKNDTKLF